MNISILPDDFIALVLSQVAASSIHYCMCKTFETSSHILLRYVTTSIELIVPDGDDTGWIQAYIMHRCGEKLGHFRIVNRHFRNGGLHVTNNDVENNDEDCDESKVNGKEGDKDSFDMTKYVDPLPTDWSVFFWYKRTLIRIVRNVVASGTFGRTDIFKISAYGTRNKKLLLDMVNEARKMAEKKPDKHINYFRAAVDHEAFRLVLRNQPRALSSVVLKEGVTQAIQDDIKDFLENKKWYKQRGIPYRRGYLLYGPPGCGKTSFVKAISGQFGYDIYEIALSDRSLTDQILNELLAQFDESSILLFEDIDAVFVARPQDEERADKNDAIAGKLSIREMKSGVTFSGLLNAIDGVASKENYIVFMTTNHIDKLDAALIRPGRIDMKQLIDYPDENQVTTFFKQFYPDCSDELPAQFAKQVKDMKCNPSVAQIQGLFVKHKKNPEANLCDIESLVEVCKDNDVSHRNLYI